MQVSHSMEVLDCQTGVPKGLGKKMEILEGSGVNDFIIQWAWEVKYFRISKGKGG